MIHIGIVGTGGMGTVHYHNYALIEGCEVVGLVDISEEAQVRAEEWHLPLYTTIKDMVKAEAVDVVDVCTPTFLHKQLVMEALRLGKHAITEKPMALHKQDVLEMFELADQMGKQIYVGQVLQFTKEIEVLRELVESGEYGKPLDAYFERLSACPRWAKDGWLFDKAKSGLLPFDLHIHDLDAIVSLFGKPNDFSFTSCGRENLSYEEHYRFLYNYPGLNVAAEAAWFNADIPFTAQWRVYFENAVVIDDKTKVTAYQFEQPPRVFDTEEEIKVPTGINLPPTGMFYRELTHFMDCVRKGLPSDKVTREQLIAVIEILEKISYSS
jgi:predicted dehydrogenase